MSTFDAVVVGSGAGGAPVAQRLAAAGMRVLVVERGKRYGRDDFAHRDEIEWCRRDRFVPSVLTDPHTRRGDEASRATPTNDAWTSVIVGGGTVHMSGFFLRAVADDARQGTRLADVAGHTAIDWAVPYADIARYYPIVEAEIGVAGASDPPLVEHDIAGVADRAAKRLGLRIQRTPRAILGAARPDEDRQACAYRLVCASYGCPNDARGSMLATYLRRGEKTGRVTVKSEHLATAIVLGDGGRARGVRVRSLRTGAEELVTAGIVVVAASAVESARLLLLSGDGFDPHAQVGSHLWFSLYVDVNGWFDGRTQPGVMTGSPFVHRTVNAGGALTAAERERWGIDRSGALDLLWQHDNPIHRAERVATESGGLVWGSALKRKLKAAFTEGRTMLCEGFGESLPHEGAYVDLDPNVTDQHGLPVARITHWHHPRDEKVAAHLADTGTRLLTAMGATNVRVRVKLGETTVLQGGTCRFGADPRTSVTTPAGHLHAVKNVYVTDGSAIPSSGTSPGTETIVANALRIADEILASTGVRRALPIAP